MYVYLFSSRRMELVMATFCLLASLALSAALFCFGAMG